MIQHNSATSLPYILRLFCACSFLSLGLGHGCQVPTLLYTTWRSESWRILNHLSHKSSPASGRTTYVLLTDTRLQLHTPPIQKNQVRSGYPTGPRLGLFEPSLALSSACFRLRYHGIILRVSRTIEWPARIFFLIESWRQTIVKKKTAGS